MGIVYTHPGGDRTRGRHSAPTLPYLNVNTIVLYFMTLDQPIGDCQSVAKARKTSVFQVREGAEGSEKLLLALKWLHNGFEGSEKGLFSLKMAPRWF